MAEQIAPAADDWIVSVLVARGVVTPDQARELASSGAPNLWQAALDLGADDFLTTPVQPRSLIARVKAVLKRART